MTTVPARHSAWTGDGRSYRILSIVGLDESDDSSGKFQAAFMVEPAQETRTQKRP
jgi:hypothetical protein